MKVIFKRNTTIIIALFLLSRLTDATPVSSGVMKENSFDTLSIIQLIDSAGSLINTNSSASRLLLKKAAIASNEIKYYAGKAKIFNTLGILVYQKGKIDSASYYFEQSLNQWELLNNKKQISNLLGNLSVILAQQNELAKAIDYNKKSLKIKIELKDTIPLANGYNNLGNLYQDIGNTEEALYFQHKSLKLRLAIMDSSRLPASYINLGDLHNLIGSLDSAKYYGNKALSIQVPNKDNWGIANSYGVLAEFHYLNNDLDSALYYVNESLSLVEKIGAISLFEEMTILKTNIFVKQQKTNEALQTISSIQSFSDPIMNSDALKIKAQIFRQLKNNRKAAFYFKKYNQLNDSLYETNQKNKVAEISANHFYELQELELKNERELRENSLLQIVNQKQEETSRLWLVIGLFALLTILCFFSFSLIKRKNEILNKQRLEIDKLLQVQKEVIEVRTTELLVNKDAISQYTLLNSNELKTPLSKILNTINLSKKEEVGSEYFFKSLKESAEELEEAVRKISKALHSR